MNVLFLTLAKIGSIKEHGIYTDILREFIKRGDTVYIVSPSEKRDKDHKRIIEEKQCYILKPQIGNIQKTTLIRKGISTILLEGIVRREIESYWKAIHFDLVLYSTPPITLTKVIKWLKKRDGTRTYLLLKDIFPQNAVDIGMLNTHGLKSLLYRYFRNKEKKLYKISDRIGCMSSANIDYVLKNNPDISSDKVELCPNSIEPRDLCLRGDERTRIRQKYGIPLDKKVLVYGGNLGKPQGVQFLIQCMESQRENDKVFFLIVGSGTEYEKMETYVHEAKQSNLMLMKQLPVADYDTMIAACDVGMIFLDHHFTIPNFPSRLLSYMQVKIPVLACTDSNTDIGKVIIDGGFGWWCESVDVTQFTGIVQSICAEKDLASMGELAFRYLTDYYDAVLGYEAIMGDVEENNT